MSVRQKQPMITTMAATDARIHFGDVLKRVHTRREHVIVEKDGLPIATIISQVDYEEYRRFLALRQLEELNKGLNREAQAIGYTEEQAYKDLKKIKKETFQQQYGRALTSRPKKTS